MQRFQEVYRYVYVVLRCIGGNLDHQIDQTNRGSQVSWHVEIIEREESPIGYRQFTGFKVSTARGKSGARCTPTPSRPCIGILIDQHESSMRLKVTLFQLQSVQLTAAKKNQISRMLQSHEPAYPTAHS
jgi:hypothetical protein